METLASAKEITDLNIDLPVYMLQHMNMPDPILQDELIQFLDERMAMVEDTDIHWEIRMGNALSILCVSQHPNSLDLCGEIYTWLEDSSVFLQQKIFRLIETALDPSIHFKKVQQWLSSIDRGHPLHLPFTLLASKNGDIDESLKTNILNYWSDEPIVGAQLMGHTKNEVFLQLIERELIWLAPFVRYLSPNEDDGQLKIIEHDLWSTLGEAWFNISYQNRSIPAWLNPAFVLTKASDINEVLMRQQEWHEHLDMHLMEKFGADLPWTREDWLKKIDTAPDFNRWKNRFLEAMQILTPSHFPHRKGLRLVQPND